MDQIDSQKLFFGLCLIVILVIAINAGLYVSLRRGQRGSQPGTISQLQKTVRKPWEKEDQALEQLSKEVAALKQHRPRPQGSQEVPPSSPSKPQP